MRSTRTHQKAARGEFGSVRCSGSTITYSPAAQGAVGKTSFPRPLQCHLYRLHWPFLLVSRASLGRPLLQPCTHHGLHLGVSDHFWRTSPLDTVAYTGLLTGEFSNSVTH